MTMQLIETKALGTAAASIDFTSIPQDATDLLVLMSSRTTTNGGVEWFDVKIEFNNNTSNLSDRVLYGTGSGVTSITDASYILVRVNSNISTSNTFGNASIYVPNYAGTTNKSVIIDSVTENNGTAAFQTITVGLWGNTAAITSVKATAFTGNLETGTIISLYKITKGSDGIVTTS
jgi:hypothetical protein